MDMASFLPIGKEVGSFSPVKEEGLQGRPNVGMSPVFTENVGRIEVALDMGEAHNLGGNGLPNTMVREGVVTLGELGVRNGATDYHRLVVSEDISLPFQGNSEVSECQS